MSKIAGLWRCHGSRFCEEVPSFDELVHVEDVCFWVEVVLKLKTYLNLDFQYSCLGYLSS